MVDNPEPVTQGGLQNSPTHKITVAEVYDFVSQLTTTAFDELTLIIGKEKASAFLFQFLPAFETLEALAGRTEKDRDRIAQLEHTIEEMENERVNRAKRVEEREKEMMDFEDHYGKENKSLWEMVEQLKVEKKTLMDKMELLAEETVEEKEKQGYVVVAEKEFQLLRNLKHQNVDQQDRIKELHEQLKQSESNEAHLKENVEKLMKQTEVMLKKNRGLQTQCKTIARERSALATQLDEVKESNLRLEQVVKETSQTCRDLESQQNNQSQLSDDSPQYSLRDVQALIHENTEMKCKLLRFGESIDLIRPGSSSEDSNFASETATESEVQNSTFELSEEKESPRSADNDSEEIVYGPINREPDEKLYPWKYQRKSSGIFKLFMRILPSGNPK